MIALCNSAHASPTVAKRPKTISLAIAAEQAHVNTRIVRGDVLRGDLILHPCAHIECHGKRRLYQSPDQWNRPKQVRHTQAPKHGGPGERADERLHTRQAKALRLDLPAQPLRGPAPVVVRVRMIEPGAMRRKQKPAVLAQGAARFAEIGREVPYMLEHLEGSDQVVFAVAAIERAVLPDAHFVCSIDVRAAVVRAGVGKPALIGPAAAAEIEYPRTAQA